MKSEIFERALRHYMTVELDADLCAGCGLCEENVSEIFKTGEYTAELKKTEVEEKLAQRVRETAEDCPTAAITIYEKSS
ncbi:MAG: ferredoxin [Spirochaetales bacterium]|nr:ferredoxin [Spirochaetales bacterium]